MDQGRTFTGAWIEIALNDDLWNQWAGRTFTGAWIEIELNYKQSSNGVGRTFTGAWIEMVLKPLTMLLCGVAPSQVRGLKSAATNAIYLSISVAPSQVRGLK